MEEISRRDFLRILLTTSAFFLLEMTLPPGALRPAISAFHKRELGKFSGDIYFNQMHTELLGRKRANRRRKYPSEKSSEKIDILIVGGGISGLDTAYYLLTNPLIRRSGAVVRVFEMDDEIGGTSKEYEWEGISYSNSAAYFYLAESEHPDIRLYRDIGLFNELIIPNDKEKNSVLIKDKLFLNFLEEGRGVGFEKETSLMQKAIDFFSSLSEKSYPEVPFNPRGAYKWEEFVQLDNTSFGNLLEKGFQTLSDVPLILRECIENYCYSSFGCSSYQISAWQGLNWFSSEFKSRGVAVLPGGNGRISTRLKEKIQMIDSLCIKTSAPVVDLEHDPVKKINHVTVSLRNEKCAYRTFNARYVVFTCPLFVSKRILNSEFPQQIRRQIERFNYSAYIVGNVFINGNILNECWDIYCLDDYPFIGKSGEDFYRRKPFMDIINSSWCSKNKKQKTVLTVYSPHPFAGQRQDLLRDEYCENMKLRIKKDLIYRLSNYGLKESNISDIRISRWGHAMFQANPGILSSGILNKIKASMVGKGIYFAGAELLGAPTIENCHFTAREAVRQLISAICGRGRKLEREAMTVSGA